MTGYGIKLSSGEYDDYRIIILRVYLNKDDAQKFINKYNLLIPKLKKFYTDFREENNKYPSKDNDWFGWDLYNKYWKFKYVWDAEIEELEII